MGASGSEGRCKMGFRNWSIRTRVIALLAATVVPLAGLGSFWITYVVREEIDQAQHSAQESAQNVAMLVGFRIRSVQELLEGVAGLPAVQSAGRREADHFLRDLLVTSLRRGNLFSVAADGTLITATAPQTPGQQTSLQDREWFQAVMGQGVPIVSGFEIGRLTGQPVAILAHPVRDAQGLVRGVVGAALRLVDVESEVAAMPFEKEAIWAVVDAQGRVLLQSRPGRGVGSPLGALPGTLRAEAAVPGTPWRAVVAIPKTEVIARARREFLPVVWPSGLLILAAAGAGLWMARSTWRPLQALAATIRRMGAGESPTVLNGSSDFPVEAGGEVGEVARALRDTLRALTSRQQELAALLKADQAITSSLDLEQILQAIAEQAAAISGAPFVRMFLLDEDSRVLRCHVVFGLSPEVEREILIPVGEGFTGEVAATGRFLAVADCRGDPRVRFPQHMGRYGLVSYLGLPLKRGDQIVGVLVFNTGAPRTYTADEIAYLSILADQAAVAIENARLFATTERAGREARSLYEVAHSLATSLDPLEVLHLIAVKTTELLGTSHAQVVLWDEAGQTLRLGAAYGSEAEKVKDQQFRLGEGVNGIVAQTRAPLIVNDYQAFAPRVSELTELVAVIGVPLLYRDRLLGVLTTHATQPGAAFTQDHLALLTTFANQAAIAIENARLYQQAQEQAVVLEQRVEERTKALKEAQAELVQSAKLAAMGTLAAGVAHELNQPLTVIRGYAQGLLADAGLDPEVKADLDRIQAQTGRMAKIINHLRDFSRQAKGTFEPVALNDVIEAAFSLLTQQLRLRNVRVVTELDPGLPVIRGDRVQLEQVFINLITNARDAMQSHNGGRLTVKTRGADPFVEAIVADTGPGIPEGIRARIFDPFFTTKEVGQGTGLGLSISYGIVRDHGGEIRAETRPGWGAVFVVRLPMAQVQGPAVEHRESRRGP